ncbi:MAG: S41 family peptidase [Bacteroidaceae bacterium]|nr:S41 family peptidase [Bacteroidaceae bacterium]
MKRTLILLTYLLLITATVSAQKLHINTGKDSPLSKLQWAEIAITNMYVDSVNENKLVEDAIRGMLEKLDPHSAYSTPEEVKELNEPLQGNFEGVGVQFNIVEDTLMIIQTINDGPSEKVGILAGDRIVSVNDTTIAGVKMQKNKIMKMLRGPKGTKVKVGIVRRGIPDVLTFNITRDKIPITTVDASYMIRPGVGYIRVGSFGATTYQEFLEALQKLMKDPKTGKAQILKSLILDLQDNGGGLLQTAVKLTNEFLEKGDLIVYTEGLKQPRQEFRANSSGELTKTKVAVLVNEFSASASEILSGALQDHDRATIIGRRTFGKGLVQRPIPLPDESMIRLTIAHYYTPSGRCIQKPYKKGDKKAYDNDLDTRYKNGEFTNADSIHFNDSLKYETLKKHRIVYGGGGIMPDIFVPLDTTQYTKFHRSLSAKSFVINANLKYIDKHRKELLAEYKDFDDFNSRFEFPTESINEMYAEAEKQNVKPKDDEEKTHTTTSLKTQLKALVARDLWSMTEYFRIMNETNHIVKAALKEIY